MYRKIFQNRRNACFRFCTDAEFPAIHGEKGITTFDLVQNVSSHHTDHSEAKLLSFKSVNVITWFLIMLKHIFWLKNMTDVVQHFEHYLDQRQLEGEAVVDNGELILTVEGKAVHGMDPSLGVNAGLYLIDFLSTLNLNQAAKEFAEFSNRYLHESHFGEKWV